ncbi:hypothetical protein [Luteipulveratus mongoliensis]|uniref:GAF domain-containing protein n=1 Tax=Luteipulveratus mongoliensis TaxID=571913 RepID=A0A0K1JIY5_9MICO|nr:hypothetical protein [Luteipulveratus mongoliensis]AKU16545.1 hypothetical protein VV02_12875 [Luteipulveratus mongoliensis]
MTTSTVRPRSNHTPGRSTAQDEVLASLPRLVADALDVPAVIVVTADGTGSMLNHLERRSVHQAPAPTVELFQLGLVVPGAVVNGLVVRAIQPIEASDGRRLGVIGVLAQHLRRATDDEQERLRAIAAYTAEYLSPVPRVDATSARTTSAEPRPIEIDHLNDGFVDQVAGATDALHSLLDAVDERTDLVLHRHAAAVRERFKVVEQASASLRAGASLRRARHRHALVGPGPKADLVDLRLAVAEAVAVAQASIPGSRFVVVMDDASLLVCAASSSVRRAVTMMLTSAAEAASSHEVHVTAAIRAIDGTSIQGRVSVELEATFQGPPLSASQLARLASRFIDTRSEQTPTDTSHRGTLLVEAGERVLTVPGFEVRSGAERTTMVADWPLDIG